MKAILLVIIWSLLLCQPLFADHAADDDTAKDDTKVYHVYDDIDLISTLKIQYDKPRIVIKSVYPQLQSDTVHDSVDTFNQLVIDLMQQKMAEFKAQVNENKDIQKSLPKYQQKNDLYLDFSASFIQSGQHPIISVRFLAQGYIAGMAHPYHHHFVVNYDLKTNAPIELNDLFAEGADYLPILSGYTSYMLSKRLHDKQMILSGTAPKPENFRNWNVKANGLLITFDEYQVAPYVEGSQTVLVPYGILRESIGNESPLAGCINYKRRCSRSSLLTGGFIDEAAVRLQTIDSHHRVFNPLLSQL